MLNFSMIHSSTSDSASTQKCLYDLLEKSKGEDSQLLPCANSECLEVVRNFCAMNLGVNLRKAFVAARVLIHLYINSANYLVHMAHWSMQLVVFSFQTFYTTKSVSAMKMNFTTGRVLMSLFHAKLAVTILSRHIMQQNNWSRRILCVGKSLSVCHFVIMGSHFQVIKREHRMLYSH